MMSFLLKSLVVFGAIILYFGWVVHSLWHSFFPTGPSLTFYQAMALVFVGTLFNIEKMSKPSRDVEREILALQIIWPAVVVVMVKLLIG